MEGCILGGKKESGLKAALQAILRRREGRRGSRSPREGLAPAPGMHSGGAGCAMSGLRLRRIRSDPIRAWAVGFAPLSGAASARAALLGTGDLPETLPLLEHRLALESYWLPAPWARLIATARARASARCGPLSPAPSLRVSGPPPPCSPRGGWVPRGWGTRASPPQRGREDPQPRPAGLPRLHLSANAERGALRLATAPVHVRLFPSLEPGVRLSLRQAD